VTQALGVREGNIVDLRDATQADLISVFGRKGQFKGRLFNWVKPGRSNVTIYYSGHASPVYMRAKTLSLPANVTVIAAGGAREMASWEKDKSHGLFTKYFLLGMSGKADAAPFGNGDGSVGYDELKRYLKDTMSYYARRYYGRFALGGGRE
jgi:hypothetical protein